MPTGRSKWKVGTFKKMLKEANKELRDAEKKSRYLNVPKTETEMVILVMSSKRRVAEDFAAAMPRAIE